MIIIRILYAVHIEFAFCSQTAVNIFNTNDYADSFVNNMKIRQFEQKDMDAVVQLANDYAFFDGPITGDDLKVTNAFPEGFIVAEKEGKVIGLAYGYFKDVPKEVLFNWKVSKVATIELLVVDPKYEKQGIGTSLLEKLVEILKQSGTDLIMLTCPVQAEQAKKLYEKRGFEINAYHMRMKVP